MMPIVDEAKEKYENRIAFSMLDITKPENDKKASSFHVYLTPTFVIADEKGKELDRLVGEVPKKTLETFITKNLKKGK